MLARTTENTSCCSLNDGNLLREVTVKIGLEISSEFAKK